MNNYGIASTGRYHAGLLQDLKDAINYDQQVEGVDISGIYFHKMLEGLQPATKYYWQGVAINSIGQGETGIQSFTIQS